MQSFIMGAECVCACWICSAAIQFLVFKMQLLMSRASTCALSHTFIHFTFNSLLVVDYVEQCGSFPWSPGEAADVFSCQEHDVRNSGCSNKITQLSRLPHLFWPGSGELQRQVHPPICSTNPSLPVISSPARVSLFHVKAQSPISLPLNIFLPQGRPRP